MLVHLTRISWRLLAMALYAVSLVAVFWLGFGLGQERVTAALGPSLSTLRAERDAAAAQLDGLKSEMTSVKQESAVLERSRQIERETNKSLQDQLKQAQEERIELIKEGNYLKRLVQEGGKGAVRVHDLRLTPGEGPRTFNYSFSVTQLIQDFGESRGRVLVSIKGIQDGKEVSLDLTKLEQADPKALSMRFEHFQILRGRFTLPEGFEPRLVTVTIEPEGELLAGTSEAFPWVVASP